MFLADSHIFHFGVMMPIWRNTSGAAFALFGAIGQNEICFKAQVVERLVVTARMRPYSEVISGSCSTSLRCSIRFAQTGNPFEIYLLYRIAEQAFGVIT